MQTQVTSGSPTGQGANVGHFVLTAIVHGASAAVDGLYHAVLRLLPMHDVELKQLGTVGPLPADDDRTKLPTLPAFQAPSALEASTASPPPAADAPVGSPAPSVFLDLDQNQESVKVEPQLVSAAGSASVTDGGADSSDQQHAEPGPSDRATVVGADRGTDRDSNQATDDSATGHPIADSGAGLGFPSLGALVEKGAVVLDHAISEVVPSEVSAGPTIAEIEAVLASARKAIDALDALIESVPAHLREYLNGALDREFGETIPDAAGVPAGADAPPAALGSPPPAQTPPEATRPR